MTLKMRNLIIVLGLILTTSSVFAQEPKIMVGGGLTYATEINNVGLHLKGIYGITDKIEGEGAFAYFFKKDYTNWSALDFNVHYMLSENEDMCFYALGGLNITFYKFEVDSPIGGNYTGMGDEYGEMLEEYVGYTESSSLGSIESSGSEIGINLGVGGRMPLSEHLNLMGELKYTLGGADYLSASVGVTYSF